jgi:superfamily II DNA or RNA helicase
MTEVVTVSQHDAVYNRITAPSGVMEELREYFTFEVPGAKYHPKVRAKIWDGKIRLFKKGLLYAGLYYKVQEFCRIRGYEFKNEHDGSCGTPNLSDAALESFIQVLNIPEQYTPRDYQVQAFKDAVRDTRTLFVSPTASGKSLIIYLVLRYFAHCKALVIVPTSALVHQMEGDFISYGCDPETIHTVSGGERNTGKRITISTWQSIYDLDKEWYDAADFGIVIGDEAHGFKADSLVGIMEKLTDCFYRFGFTGTLDGSKTNKMVLEGLFGKVRKTITTRELIDRGMVADLKIKAICLEHPKSAANELWKVNPRVKSKTRAIDYDDEIKYLVNCEPRNQFIANMALNMKGNTLILYRFVEKHGDILHDMILEAAGEDRKVFYVSGKMKGKARDDIRAQIEAEDNSITVASFGTTSTGINIRRINNIIFASPWKSEIINLQSIGRGLRMGEGKTVCNLYDLSDSLALTPKKLNHGLKHHGERIRIYCEQEFDYKVYKVPLAYG